MKGVSLLYWGLTGAGKSTTLKAISGLLKHEDGAVTDGNIEFLGDRIDKLPAEKIAQKGIVQVIEGRRVFEHLYSRAESEGRRTSAKKAAVR